MTKPIEEGGDGLKDLVPQFCSYTHDVLHGEVWERPGLSRRDRSLITIAALLAMYRPDQLRGHLSFGLDNGLSAEEIGELITHLAFYASWPSANSAAYIFKALMEQRSGAQ